MTAFRSSPSRRRDWEDWKIAVYLSLTSFRGSSRLLKGRREYRNDPELEAALERLERSMVTFLVGMAGLIAATLLAMRLGGTVQVLLALLLWVVLDILLVSPLLYFLFLPKPIRAHRKKESELTEEEREMWKRSNETACRAERILKKYKHTGLR